MTPGARIGEVVQLDRVGVIFIVAVVADVVIVKLPPVPSRARVEILRRAMSKRKAVEADNSGASQPVAPGAKHSRASRQAVGADNSGASQPAAPCAKQGRASRQGAAADNSGAPQPAGAGQPADPLMESMEAIRSLVRLPKEIAGLQQEPERWRVCRTTDGPARNDSVGTHRLIVLDGRQRNVARHVKQKLELVISPEAASMVAHVSVDGSFVDIGRLYDWQTPHLTEFELVDPGEVSQLADTQGP